METSEEKESARQRFKEKRERRIERAEALSEKNEAMADSRYKSFRAIGDRIPMGQPIMIGHHSEKSHRADLKRMDNHMKKISEHVKASEHYKEKAESIRRSKLILSDDPDAIEKLESKVEGMQQVLDEMKRINKEWRKKGSLDLVDCDDKMRERALSNMNCWRGGPPFPAYSLTSYSTKIREMKKRAARLEKASEFESFEIEGVKVFLEDGYIKLNFPEKPGQETINTIKRSPLAFKWSRFQGMWVRKNTGFPQWWVNDLREAVTTWKK